MKALTIKQPWATLIMQGTKKVENRTWATRYRGELVVHAGLALFDGYKHLALSPGHPRGHALGTIELIDCVELKDAPRWVAKHTYTHGPFCWILRNPKPFDKTIPIKGSLGLWEMVW